MGSFADGLMLMAIKGEQIPCRFTRKCGILLLDYINRYREQCVIYEDIYEEGSDAEDRFFKTLHWMRNHINKRWNLEENFTPMYVELTKDIARQLKHFMGTYKYEGDEDPLLDNAFKWITNQISKKYSLFNLYP